MKIILRRKMFHNAVILHSFTFYLNENSKKKNQWVNWLLKRQSAFSADLWVAVLNAFFSKQSRIYELAYV